MTNRRYAFVICCALFLFNAPPLQSAQKGNEKTSAITGAVVGDDGNPIPGASVIIAPARLPAPIRRNTVTDEEGRFQVPAPIRRNTVTDEEGRFQVMGLDRDVYRVMVTAPAYYFPQSQDPVPQYYRVGDNVSITLNKGGVITGRVTQASGEPAVAVPVRAIQVRDAQGRAGRTLASPAERFTDDRGVYRIYGLPAGTYVIVSGGRGTGFAGTNFYSNDAPTYYPSATRDSATEITVRGGDEIGSIDIKYRGDRGHAISGIVLGSAPTAPEAMRGPGALLTLIHALSRTQEAAESAIQRDGKLSFAFYGIADGDYDLIARRFGDAGGSVSKPRRVRVGGTDVTGIELTLAPLGSIAGQVILEPAAGEAGKCKVERQGELSEIIVLALHDETKESPFPSPLQSTLGDKNDFKLRDLEEGQYELDVRLPSDDWHVREISMPGAVAQPAQQRGRATAAAASAGIQVKSGQQLDGLKIAIARGAAGLRGWVVPAAEGSDLPSGLRVHLVPAEREHANNTLRYAEAPVAAAGTFSFSNIAPGKYWLLVREAPDSAVRRTATNADSRAKLRREAEGRDIVIDLAACQRVSDYVLRK